VSACGLRLGSICAIHWPFQLCACAQESARPPANHDPEATTVSTVDVDLFWHAYEEWRASANSAPDQLAVMLDCAYFRKGSTGVQDFILNRVISGDAHATPILKDPKYPLLVAAIGNEGCLLGVLGQHLGLDNLELERLFTAGSDLPHPAVFFASVMLRPAARSALIGWPRERWFRTHTSGPN
jgi:hypothetical protein